MGPLGKKNKPQANTTTSDFDLNDMGVMPTMKRQVLGNGMILGLEENSVWLYGKVPTAPVADARDSQRRLEAYRPLFETLDQIAADTPRAAVKRRSVAKNAYRKVHILRTNVPKTWHADVIAPRERRLGQDTLNQWLNSSLPETTVKQSILTLGVQLVPSTISTGFKGALDSVTFTLLEGGTPLVDYDRDLEKMKRIFDRTGVDSLSGSEIASLDSWWNPGRNPDVVTLSHPDHLHVIRDKRTTRAIKKMEADGVDCEDWPDDIRESPDQNAGQAVVSFGSISDLQLNFTDPVQDPQLANWALPLLDAGAMAVSIRGAVEPAEITREELRRNKRGYQNDIQERVKNNKMEKQEQEEKVEVLGQVESVYANRRGTPTLISASGLVAFDGKVEDWDTVVRSAAELQAMEHRQSRAWAEMMICSMRTANPNLMDMPIQNLACSGINDVSKVGDKWGIVRGFTESDKQPAYYNVEEAYQVAEASPMSGNIGASGSGKTLLMQWEMFQTNLLDYPQIVVDPKALALDTAVPTPDGWSTIGELQPGDRVFDRSGKPVSITHKSEVFDPDTLQMYQVHLSNGGVLRADSQHLWVVATPAARTAIEQGEGMSSDQLLQTALSAGHLAQDMETPRFLSTEAIIFLLHESGCRRWMDPEDLHTDLQRSEVPAQVREVHGRQVHYWNGPHAMLVLALQAREEAALGSQHYTVLTTAEMVARAETGEAQASFAIPAAKPIQRPDDLSALGVEAPQDGSSSGRSDWVYVEDIVPTDPEPAQCIRVDSEDHTFLAGEALTVTHNTKSDLTPVVEAMPNGRVYSLDELSKYDGIFDAVKFSPNPDVAVEFALATIATLNPYGTSGKMSAAEPDLIEALHYGISKGHRSTLTALNRAVRNGVLEEHHVTQIEKLSKSSPMFSALVGHSDEGEGLGSYEGTTLIKVGDQELNLPEPGAEPSGIIQRINLALVRNIVFASAMALNKRKGVLRLDEAWVFTSNSPRELERLGRLARSQTIDVELYTQRISDALDANLRNYLTRGLILHMRDPVEAKAACAVFDLEASEERIGRIRAAGTLDNDSASPNFNSLKALKDPVTREVIRGSVGLYVDIHGRVVPVEIRVPDRFLKLASTNISDIEAREAEADELAREEILA